VGAPTLKMELRMSLSRNIAMVAASIAAALVAAPASAQTLDKATAPKAAANFAAPTSGAMPQSSAPATIRSTSKAQAAGDESGSGKAPTAANDAK
jgi:hypothetical protein